MTRVGYIYRIYKARATQATNRDRHKGTHEGSH